MEPSSLCTLTSTQNAGVGPVASGTPDWRYNTSTVVLAYMHSRRRVVRGEATPRVRLNAGSRSGDAGPCHRSLVGSRLKMAAMVMVHLTGSYGPNHLY